MSECSVPVHRSVAIRLAESVHGLTNGGDVLDDLSGKWLERLGSQWFRVTALLTGSAAEVWTTEKLKLAHITLHDAIRAKHTLDPSEVAALIFHAYIGGDPRRLAKTAIRLQQIDGKDAKREIERQLLWLPFVALDPGQFIIDDEMAEGILRGLQFQVALTLDSDYLPQICARWADAVKRIKHPKARAANRAMMNLFTGVAQNPKVPLKARLDAIIEIPELPREILKAFTESNKHFFESANGAGGLPKKVTTSQTILLCANMCVRDLVTLDELLHWLDNMATEDIRQQFDEMLEWPLVQQLGAFMQGAWCAVHEQTKDWVPWLILLTRVEEYAKRRRSPRFGREAAKARAIILTEYLDQDQEALKVLDSAEAEFGQSVVLMEQRANVLFQTKNDESVLEIWHKLTNDPSSSNFLDPYAYRRIGMSAARLKQWDKAEQIFNAAVNSIQQGTFEVTKFGLRVDAALSIFLGGKQSAAAMQLADAVLALPAEAAKEGDARWEAVQRAAVAVCIAIENSLWKQSDAKPQFEPGYASAPDLKVPKIEPGQAVRSELTRAQILHLVSILATFPVRFANDVKMLLDSKYLLVRGLAAEAQLALAYSAGAGDGFIEALLTFDRAITDRAAKIQQGTSLLTPDDGVKSSQPVAPQRWFGLICAGAVCSGPHLISHLKIWLDASAGLLSEEAALTKIIQLLLEGASLPPALLQPTIIDTASPLPLRCGAAAQLLMSGIPAGKTLHLQSFLTSAIVSDDSFARQLLCNHHVARCFADAWRTHAKSPFQFYSPRTSVPELLAVLDAIEQGSATLKNLLVVAASSLRQSLGKLMERVL